MKDRRAGKPLSAQEMLGRELEKVERLQRELWRAANEAEYWLEWAQDVDGGARGQRGEETPPRIARWRALSKAALRSEWEAAVTMPGA